MGKHDALFRLDEIINNIHCVLPQGPICSGLLVRIVIVETNDHHVV